MRPDRHIPLKQMQEYLYFRDAENDSRSRKNKARDYLKDFIAEHGEPDEDGHIRYELDGTITINDSEYRGLMNQRRVTKYINEGLALDLVHEKGIDESRIIKYEPVYDWDELYVLNQTGEISDEELDSVITIDESWALVPIK